MTKHVAITKENIAEIPLWDRLYLVSYMWYASAWAFRMLLAVMYVLVPWPFFPGGNEPKP